MGFFKSLFERDNGFRNSDFLRDPAVKQEGFNFIYIFYLGLFFPCICVTLKLVPDRLSPELQNAQEPDAEDA